MDLFSVTPIRPADAPGAWTPGLLRALLLRAQFSPARARALGWRGLRPSLAFGEAWTCKIHDFPGVFGLRFEGEEGRGRLVRGSFSLHHFPEPGSARAEGLPLAAAVLCQRPEYWDQVREFPGHEITRELFGIGRIELEAEDSGAALGLCLSAQNRLRLVSVKGLDWPPGSGRYLVPPGGLESDLPAFGPALLFFRVLAATVSQVLGQPPRTQTLDRLPGRRQSRAGGTCRDLPDPGLRLLELRLEYGRGSGTSAFPEPFQRQPWRFSHLPGWFGRQTQGRGELPELLLLTGFLGAGKTTLLRRLIEHNQQRDRFVAVIQNEIGAVGLDGRLLEQDSPVLEMDEGCVCCSLSGQLKKGLERILAEYKPDLVVLEMSGLANPANLLSELREVRHLVRRGPVLAVVDAPDLERALAESAVAREQIRSADLVVLNKCDLLDRNGIDRALALARGQNPRALALEAEQGAMPFGLLLDPDLGRQSEALADLLPHFHSLETHAGEGFSAQTLRLDRPLAAARLRPALEDAARRAFRIKGVLDVAGGETPLLVQAVAGRLDLSPLPGQARPERFLVCIGRDLPANFAQDLGRRLGA